MIHAILHWLGTAVSTYLLHSEHGNGYQFWSSGPGPGIGQLSIPAGLLVFLRHKNCEERGCWRLGHVHPEHGRPVCRKHYHSHEAPTDVDC